MDDALLAKEEKLKQLIKRYGNLVIAYSGGVDSTYLADVAHEVLGPAARLVIADTPSMPRAELDEAVALAKQRGWNLTVIRTNEFSNEDYLRNDRDRCYICKGELFATMRSFARENGITVLAYGENADDTGDVTRYGRLAAQENEAVAPLLLAELHKSEIRELSRKRGLPTWDKASFACLSSRFPAGTRLTIADMAKVERAEEALKRLGFHQYRARHHGDLCRIELDVNDLAAVLDPKTRETLIREITALGYRYVTLDLAGYRTGSTAAPLE